MKKERHLIKLIGCGVMLVLILSGCSIKRSAENEHTVSEEETGNRGETSENEREEEQETSENGREEGQETSENEREEKQEMSENEREEEQETSGDEKDKGQETSWAAESEEDWSKYFGGFHGAAVLYDPLARQFRVYNKELAETRRSPCSTFKIISSLTALEHGLLDPDDSVRRWSGEVFWNENWNRDIDFKGAFRDSCVWYFREVIDEIGQERMQEELDRLSYGNCDISDWEGRLNTNNNNRALTGFWVESSLSISPKEQTKVMERIFGKDSAYSEETKNALKEVMLLKEQQETGFSIYGKTGMGKAQGIVVDAWFTGFAEGAQGNVYFCVYLGRSDGQEASSAAAKEIAVRLVSDMLLPDFQLREN